MYFAVYTVPRASVNDAITAILRASLCGPNEMANKDTKVTNVKYRGPVEMSGWVMKYQSRVKGRQVRRYFRLNNSILANHQHLTAKPTWEISVSKCVVKTLEAKGVVSVRLVDREIRFQLVSVELMNRWATAIRSASVCNIGDFYRLGEQLGCGSFGAVRLAFDLSNGKKRAVKIVERTTNAKELEFVQREINVLLSISHPNVVRTYDIFDERDRIYLVMEYISGGDLFDYMSTRTTLPELLAKHVLWQILEGIAYLHRNNIVHRDIKPENVLVVSEDPLRLQLTDFGFANFVDPFSTEPQSEMKSLVGTGCYMSPEVIDARGHGKPVDLFASGVLIFRVISGHLPFRGNSLRECYNQAIQGRPDFSGNEWDKTSDSFKQLCTALVEPDPSNRPTAEEALAHPCFTEDTKFKSERDRYELGDVVKKVQSLTAVQATGAGNGTKLQDYDPGSHSPASPLTEPRSSPWH